MSISKTHETPQQTISQPSLEERILANLEIIKDLAKCPTFFPKPPDHDPDIEILRGQVLSVVAKGFSLSQLAKAMAVSDVYLRTMLSERSALTRSQYELVLATCKDLEEASGSGSSQAAPPMQPPLPQISELSLRRKSEEEEKKANPIPLKKRKTWRVLFEKEKETEPSDDQQALRQREELSLSLKVLLDTVLNRKRKKSSLQILCPRKGSEQQHICSTCTLTYDLFHLKNCCVCQQLKILLAHTSKETLLKVLVDLLEKGEISILKDKKALSHLELAYISDGCQIGEAMKLPGQKSPSEEVTLYRAMTKVIKEDIEGTLSRLIKQLWESDKPVSTMESFILVEEENKTLSSVSVQSLRPVFSSLSQRRLYSKRRGDHRQGLSETFVDLLSKLTMASLQAFKNSTLCSPYLTQTPSGSIAVPKEVLTHIYALILVLHPKWKVEVVPTKASFGLRDSFSLPEPSIKKILPALRNFIHVNQIQTRVQYFGDLSTKQKPRQTPPETINTEKIKLILRKAIQTSTQPTTGEPKKSRKRASSRRHLRITAPKKTSTPIESICEEESIEESLEKSKTITESLLLLLESILQSKGLYQLTVVCPKSSEHVSRNTCSLCLLANQISQKKCSNLVHQLKSLLKYTKKEILAQALMSLFSLQSITELEKKQKFSNFEIACIIRVCGIGDEICCPGKLNPGSQVEIYCALNDAICSGLDSPEARAILEVWETPRPLPYPKQKELLYILVMESDDSVKNWTYENVEEKLRPLAQRLFSTTEEGPRRRKYLDSVPSTYLKFITNLTLFTAKALRDFPLGAPFFKSSPEGPALLRSTLDRVYCMILLANPIRKIVVLPSKISPEKVEEFSLSASETTLVHSKLLKFARTNRFFLSGSGSFSLAKNPPEKSPNE